MSAKTRAVGICDFCGGSIPPAEWYTTKGRPRLYCSIECRNTANSRAGNTKRIAKARERVARGQWRNPAPPETYSSEEQSRRARLGRQREVAEGRWRNPALSTEARQKLSRPRTHADNLQLHAILARLTRGEPLAEMTPEEKRIVSEYRKKLRAKRKSE